MICRFYSHVIFHSFITSGYIYIHVTDVDFINDKNLKCPLLLSLPGNMDCSALELDAIKFAKCAVMYDQKGKHNEAVFYYKVGFHSHLILGAFRRVFFLCILTRIHKCLM